MASRAKVLLPAGRLYLMIAILIFGAANAVTRKLTEIGAQNLIDGRNPISFCNVLFVGNICALALLLVIYQRQLRPSVFRQITAKQWGTLTSIAILGGAIVPMLVFTALSITAVNNVVLISQIDAPLALALAIVVLGERVNRWVVAGAIVAFIGVALTVLLQPPETINEAMQMGFMIGRGELMVIIAAVLQAISNLISKISLQTIPLGFFNIYRTFIGTIFFFVATIILFEPSHFMDVTSPFLWRWMLIYSAVIVVGGQLAWFSGLKRSSASEVSLAGAFDPIAGVLAAYLILGEVPTTAQYIGGAVILVGIALNQIGLLKLSHSSKRPPKPAEMGDEEVLYKGV
jgi:drug/metabolite transporter (DMT)-like permease